MRAENWTSHPLLAKWLACESSAERADVWHNTSFEASKLDLSTPWLQLLAWEQNSPWAHFCFCILLTRTRRQQVETVLHELFTCWPNAESLERASKRELQAVLEPCGMAEVKAKALRLMSLQMLVDWPCPPQVLFGIGNYGSQSYYTFMLKQLLQNVTDPAVAEAQAVLAHTAGA